MSEIIVSRGRDPRMPNQVLASMFRLRHEIFKEKLGWEVSTENGMEHDPYDEMNPYYMVVREGPDVRGCWRFLPTTGPYMLKDTFPALLGGAPAPVSRKIWELSRFAVAGGRGDVIDHAQVPCNPMTLAMLREAVEFADRHGIEAYVTVTSASLERLFKRMGIPMTRLGDGRAQRIGKVLTVACHIAIDGALREAVTRPMLSRSLQVAA